MAQPIAPIAPDGPDRHAAPSAADPASLLATQPAGKRRASEKDGFAGRIPANKGKRYPPEVLTPIEVQALLDACAMNPHTELRNRALLTTLYRSGLRCSEALSLASKDVDFINMSIRVLHGKGDRARTVGIDPAALRILELWVSERTERGFTHDQPLFCTRLGVPGQDVGDSCIGEDLRVEW